jgi:hypothetical protein
MTKNKWFDKLTTLSRVEGQYPNSNHQCSKQVLAFDPSYIRPELMSKAGRIQLISGPDRIDLIRCIRRFGH